MIFTFDLNKAIRGCLDRGIPFAVWRKPNDKEIKFCANPSRNVGGKVVFSVNLWNSNDLVSIYSELDVGQTLQYLAHFDNEKCELSPIDCIATNKAEYLQRVDELIGKLKQRGGKTVISRTTIGTAVGVDWCVVAEQYFERFGSAFAYLYYTPETGAWLGASPELLLAHDKCGNTISTMSLAGTRKVNDITMPWDEKNIKEQQLVTDFIINELQDAGLKVNVGEVTTLNYGLIEHLCTRISAIMTSEIQFIELANKLSPTPALAGYPRKEALEEIAQIETHSRRCYGGYIYVDEPTMAEAFVNLRCVNFDSHSWCIFSGGGITADSNAESEWLETEAKALVLLTIIKDNVLSE